MQTDRANLLLVLRASEEFNEIDFERMRGSLEHRSGAWRVGDKSGGRTRYRVVAAELGGHVWAQHVRDLDRYHSSLVDQH